MSETATETRPSSRAAPNRRWLALAVPTHAARTSFISGMGLRLLTAVVALTGALLALVTLPVRQAPGSSPPRPPHPARPSRQQASRRHSPAALAPRAHMLTRPHGPRPGDDGSAAA